MASPKPSSQTNSKQPDNEDISEGPCGPDLLIMLPPRSKLFDNVSTSGSEVSELSEPFSDFGNTPEIEPNRGSEDLCEQDLYTALSFSSEFKSAMDSIRAENLEADPLLSEVASMMAESYEQIKLGACFPQIHRKIPLTTQMKIVNMLNDRAFKFSPESSEDEEEQKKPAARSSMFKSKKFVPDDKKTWEDIKDEILGGKKDLAKEITKIHKKEKTKKAVVKEEELAYETMSGYWRLLSVYDEFQISPPGYDAYEQDQPHWLQAIPVPLTVFEGSRKKCLEWLRKYFQNY